MKLNRTGITRIVFEFKTFVIKIPNFSYSWRHFLTGIIANISENIAWKNADKCDIFLVTNYFGNYEKRSDLLCPVKWCSWGGWFLIMEKADMERHENEVRSLPDDSSKFSYSNWINSALAGDDKADNYGYYKNRLVKIDYPD